MVRTAQDLIEQARLKEILKARDVKSKKETIRTATAGLKRELALEKQAKQEKIDKFKSYFKRPQPVSSRVKKLDTRVGAIVRKVVHLAAPKGFVKSLTRPKGSSKGRGRPSGTYKTRYVPGVGAVKVPTHIYKRMLAEAKAKRRLAEAKRQAGYQQQIEAEQIAMQQDPRFQPSQEEAWAEGEDIQHEADVQQTKQRILQQQYQQQLLRQMEQQQRPGIMDRAGDMFGKARLTLMGTDRSRQAQLGMQQQFPQRPNIESLHRPQIQSFQRPNPQVSVTGGKSPMFSSGGPSILSQGNEFNRKDQAVIGFGGW